MARILVADDEDDGRALYALWLGDGGHEVIEARDGAEAQQLLADSDFDVVVIDLLTPRVDGLSVIKDLRTQPGMGRDTGIVAMSAGTKALPAGVGLSLSAMFGADEVLYKPFERSDLLAVVTRIVGQATGGPLSQH